MGNSSSGSSPPSSRDDSAMFAKDGTTPRLYELAKVEPGQWPIVYSSAYNIGFLGMEKIHPFDSAKWGKVYKNLIGEIDVLLRKFVRLRNKCGFVAECPWPNLIFVANEQGVLDRLLAIKWHSCY